jgi:predicted dienelactone hydrolase
MLLFLLACSPFEPVLDDAPVPAAAWAPPDAPGPYAVGVRTIEVPSALGGSLQVEVWYPALPSDAPADYELFAVEVGGEAHRDAELDVRDTTFPVVAFSHGFGGVRFQSWFLTERLASHGMVVVAPDHPGTTLLDFDLDGAAAGGPRRPRDVVDAVDGLAALGWPVDTSSYAVVGHSFGAWTALVVGGGVVDAGGLAETCATADYAGCQILGDQGFDADLAATYAVPDERARVTVALAPGAWYSFGADGAGLASVRDALVIGGTRDGDLPWDEEGAPTWEHLAPPRALALLEGAGHWAFSDLCALLPLEDCAGADAGFMDPAEVHDVTARATTAWIRWRLGGSDADAAAMDAGGWVVER